jgi:hypothetical protein
MNVKLLRKIQAAIKAEPRRFVMNNWINRRSRVAPCGTSACIAGHAVLLSFKLPWKEAAGLRLKEHPSIEAMRLLKLSYNEATLLFYESAWPYQFKPGRGTTLAKHAIARIDHFIRTKGRE